MKPLGLDVTVTCRGAALAGLSLTSDAQARYVTLPTESGAPLLVKAERFELPRRKTRAEFRYRVELERAARERAELSFAFRSGEALLAPASSFLLSPLPLAPEVPIELAVEGPPGFGFRSGLRERQGGGYALESHELRVATYSVFGRFSERRVHAGGGRVDLIVLDEPPSLSGERLAPWVSKRAEAVARFYGTFPAERTTVFVVPVEGRDGVLFGNLLPQSAPAIALRIGARTTPAALEKDWILLHELFHLGVPSFHREGKWFDEGLATYFEPILRVRAGFSTERELWAELARDLPLGLPALTQVGLERGRDYTDIYWGGALFCFIADVELRRRSAGVTGLEDGVRAVFAEGGVAWEVWSLQETFEIAERAVGHRFLQELAARHAAGPAAFDLEGLLRDLGVIRGEAGIELRDDAPLAAVRRAIVTPIVRERATNPDG